ncbi:MAG TPA: iron-containing alcohol dehydrogenase [Streptomyces sp.]|uniref:iron-containing alcohol dehydrogenase n=1 Tax=Streptomyces sp. TaxID=1931 RepID=UPI002C10AE76|nr:iron-containing alcohol dehydrogenase [Streptomyces sp.]HWU06171.1 iron-containing alcohol dehydrogenase [Streptomyces sp.]
MPISTFDLTRLERVASGIGASQELAAELDQRGASRVLVVTTGSLLESTALTTVRDVLGPRLVGVRTTAQHAPSDRVQDIARALDETDADAVVSLGGGSAIDSAKVAIASRLAGRDVTSEAGVLDPAAGFGPGGDTGFLHIAMPTTLSAGAFTPAGGVSHVETHLKFAIIRPELQPRVVIHDAELTLETPARLWLSTGMRALDHAVEAIYARRHHPLSDAVAEQAIRILVTELPRSVGTGHTLDSRQRCLDGAWMSLFGGFNTGLGLSHSLGHQIGPAWDVPHGYTSCIMLPHAMRFMAEVAPERFGPIARALDVPYDAAAPHQAATACAERVRQFISAFDLPTSLEEVGANQQDLPRVAEQTREELAGFDAVDRPVSADELLALLRAAFPRTAQPASGARHS